MLPFQRYASVIDAVVRGSLSPRVVGRRVRTAYQSLIYGRPEGGTPEYLGDMLGSELMPQGIDIRAVGGVLRLESLGPGAVSIRLSREGAFPARQSYSLAASPIEGTGPIVIVSDLPTELRLARPGLRISIQRSPCRLSFFDESGALLCSDVDGAGWQGGGVVCTHRLDAARAVYGLGEKAYGLNHRGRRLTFWNTDPKGGRYAWGTDPIYTNIPFAVFQEAGTAHGVLFDNSYRARFDLGYTQPGALHYWAAGGELAYIVLAGPTISDVLARYADLTGHMELPPRWALGYHQSRWGYVEQADVRRVKDMLRQHRIPCDAVYLDIDYMEGYRVFTWDRRRFPDMPGLVAELAASGLRTVAIIDPGVKADPAYHVCADGLEKDMFCRLPSGEVYSGPVWPGDCHFPDFANERVRAWWGQLNLPLLDAGVAGLWNDMNEPAVFPGRTFPDAVQHRADRGPSDHRALHNVYGQLMAEASAAGLRAHRPSERPFLISRADFSGIQRSALTWTGDNDSSWEHLRLSLPMILNLGLSGQPFAGADVGGFNGECTGELMVRWTQVGAFLPFFRNHNGAGNPPQEPYAFSEPYLSICRKYIEWRYRLLHYIYTAFWQAATTGKPVARPLALAFPSDRRVASLDDQFLLGDALLVAPILAPGSTGRAVYLPAGQWYDFWSSRLYEGPTDIPVPAPLRTLPLFVRAGSVVPIGPVVQHTDEDRSDRVELHLFPGSGESFLYEDDGATLEYRRGISRVTRFSMSRTERGIVIDRDESGSYAGGFHRFAVIIRGAGGLAPRKCLVDGVPIAWEPAQVAGIGPVAGVGLFRRFEIEWA